MNKEKDTTIKKDDSTKENEEPIDVVDEASMESFPASDPPNYTQRKPEHENDHKK